MIKECINKHDVIIGPFGGRTTNGEIGPVADQIYEIWNRTIFFNE